MTNLFVHTEYKYGVKDINYINVIFNTSYVNINLTNELCGGDPVFAQVKYLYTSDWTIICKENDIVNININYTIDNVNDYNIEETKFEGIDGIYWINLDRSKDRRTQFKFINNSLFDLTIPITRISAIDGKKVNMKNIIINFDNLNKNNMSLSEIGTLLSHLKTLYEISLQKGEYFLILEDDADICNMKYITSLKDIIKDAPDFDILLIYKTILFARNFDLYSKFYINNQIYGALAYIVKKQNIKKILDLFEYTDGIFKFKTNYISPSDWFIYQNTNTYVYKYNIIIQNCKESTIHNDHLDSHNKSMKIQNEILLSNLNNGIIKELYK
jgi:GR25 family glycosyltransferase involved in LPS biosynthesis